jgi:hypothetical protein
MRVSVVSTAACGVLVGAGLAFGAASFSDSAGDQNAAPDITNVQVSEAPEGVVTIVVGIRNYQALPGDSWFNLWFDLDSNQSTGETGDEVLVRYVSTGEVEIYDWDGRQMVQRPAPAGITGRFAGGVLTVTVPTADLGGDSTFGVLTVSSRRQQLGESAFIASDFSPDRGRSAYVGPAQAAYADAADDEDQAPDITAVRVADRRDGWISFAVTTANLDRVPDHSVLELAIDKDNRQGTGDAGAELLLRGSASGSVLERWDPSSSSWAEDSPPTRARVRNTAGVVTFEIHRSELADAPRFGFALTSADLNPQAQLILAVDLFPDNGGFHRYALVNKAAVTLVATKVKATPVQPRAGRPFAVDLPVRRSDTRRPISSGTVACAADLGGRRLRGSGSVARGAGRCTFAIPASAAGMRLRGTITVRAAGRSVAARFAYVVR